jgi:hypothetical protein
VTGFSPRVRRLVRTRAGSGDPHDACCEACMCWLGEYAGEVQHIVARGMGGCKRAVINSCANAALLCPACHRLAESRDPRMWERGFWLLHGTDPRLTPMTLFSGDEVWRSETEARYLYEPPRVVAA